MIQGARRDAINIDKTAHQHKCTASRNFVDHVSHSNLEYLVKIKSYQKGSTNSLCLLFQIVCGTQLSPMIFLFLLRPLTQLLVRLGTRIPDSFDSLLLNILKVSPTCLICHLSLLMTTFVIICYVNRLRALSNEATSRLCYFFRCYGYIMIAHHVNLGTVSTVSIRNCARPEMCKTIHIILLLCNLLEGLRIMRNDLPVTLKFKLDS